MRSPEFLRNVREGVDNRGHIYILPHVYSWQDRTTCTEAVSLGINAMNSGSN